MAVRREIAFFLLGNEPIAFYLVLGFVLLENEYDHCSQSSCGLCCKADGGVPRKEGTSGRKEEPYLFLGHRF